MVRHKELPSNMSTDTEKKRDNHFVPRAYLKQWSNNGNTVWTYNTIVWNEHQKFWESKGVGGLAHWKDFYTQVKDDGTIDDSVEAYFDKEYESKTGEAFKKVREDSQLSDEVMDTLVDFAILQMVRTPAWFSYYSAAMADAFPLVTNKLFDKLEAELASGKPTQRIFEKTYRAPYYEPFPQLDINIDVDDKTKEITVTLPMGRRSFLASIGQILKGGVAKRMRDYNWAVIEMPKDVLLPTCDNPFVRLLVRPGMQPTLDAGVGDKNAALFMPLTPRHLLFVDVGGRTLDERQLTEDPWVIDLIRESIVQNAVRYVYYCKPSDWIVDMRPRRVDREYCLKIDEVMRSWHDSQD